VAGYAGSGKSAMLNVAREVLIAGEVEELRQARRGLDAYDPHHSRDVERAYRADPALAHEAAGGNIRRAVQAMRLEGELRRDAPARAQRFVEHWTSSALSARLHTGPAMFRANGISATAWASVFDCSFGFRSSFASRQFWPLLTTSRSVVGAPGKLISNARTISRCMIRAAFSTSSFATSASSS
jgi:hypothetical protein